MADDFLTTYAPLSNDIAQRTGIDPSVVLGIIDTETGHGVHVSGNNIFGISPSGPSGQYVAGYPDVQTASNAFINLMQTPRYAPVAAAPDPVSQSAALVKSGYNTANPNYASIVANKALQFGKQLGYQDSSGNGVPQNGASINVTSSQPAPNYNGQPAPAPTPAPAAPDYNTPAPTQPPASAPAPPPPSGAAKGAAESDADFLQRTGAAVSGAKQDDPDAAFLARTGAAPSGTTATTAPPAVDLSQGYVGPDGSWVPPQAIPDVKSSIPVAPPVTSLEDLRSRIQQGDVGAINALKPSPDAGPVEQLLRHAAMVPTHLAAGLLQMPVNALIGLSQGPSGGVTWNPQTGTYGLTPEAAAVPQLLASGLGGRDLQFSGASPLEFVPPSGTLDARPPIPPGTATNLLTPAAKARAAEISYPSTDIPTVTVRPPGAQAAQPSASAPAPNLPPVPDGSVRLYHGGSDPTSGGARWVTPDYAYARDYRPGQPVSYVDVPKDNPAVQAAIASHPDEPMRVASFNAPEDIAAQLRPVAQPTHIYASADHDYPVTPTGAEYTHTDGRVYAQVRNTDGSTSIVPKDQLVANSAPQQAATSRAPSSPTGIPPPPAPTTVQPGGAAPPLSPADIQWAGGMRDRLAEIAQENREAGIPGSVGAAATPEQLATLTPAQMKAYRAQAELGDILAPPVRGPDNSIYVHGSKPTLAEYSGDPATSQRETLYRERAPNEYNPRLDQNNQARVDSYENQMGTQPQLDDVRTAKAAAAERDGAAYMEAAGPLDMRPQEAWLNQKMADPRIQQSPDRMKVLGQLKDALYDQQGNLLTDPGSGWGIHDNLIDRLDKQGDRTSSERYATKLLTEYKKIVDGVNNTASGGAFQTFLDNQSAHARQINSMEELQKYRPRLTNQSGKINAVAFHKFVADLAARRARPGVDPAMGISDDTMHAMINIDKDLKRMGNIDLGKARGSPTNLLGALAQSTGVGIAHLGVAALSHGNPAANLFLQGAMRHVHQATGNALLRRAARRGLAPPPGGYDYNPLQPPSAPP